MWHNCVNFLSATGRRPRHDMCNYPIPSWTRGLLRAILKNRMVVDGEYTIHNRVVYRLITQHICDVPLELRGWLTPRRLMIILRFVPVGDGLWKEPCLTKGCKGQRRDGTPCTYGHPVLSKADAADNWRDPVAEGLIPRDLFEEVDNRLVNAISPLHPSVTEKLWRGFGSAWRTWYT